MAKFSKLDKLKKDNWVSQEVMKAAPVTAKIVKVQEGIYVYSLDAKDVEFIIHIYSEVKTVVWFSFLLDVESFLQ